MVPGEVTNRQLQLKSGTVVLAVEVDVQLLFHGNQYSC